MKRKIWIDEAWRGPWYGPVVACALSFAHGADLNEVSKLIADSKSLTEKKRRKAFDFLIAHSHKTSHTPLLHFGVWLASSEEIDRVGIKEANRLAMERALKQVAFLIERYNDDIDSVLIDGNDHYRFDSILTKAPLSIIKGDTKIKEIQAASIIAKVWRDELMKAYHLIDPSLGLDTNQWYGTKKHQEAITQIEHVSEFHRKSYAPIRKQIEQKPKLLLHICCGPDATVPIMDLKKEYDLLCFWYDPNIQPKAEYDKRFDAFKKVCEIEWVPYIEWEYDVGRFFQVIKWYEDTPERGEKCTLCYDMRLERSARLGKELWYTHYTSTLNTSPHKDLEKMFSLGDKYGREYGLEFLKIAFRKNNGFQRSVDYTHEHNIYRQDYCGCVYSDTFPLRVRNAKEKIMKRGFSG